MTSRASAAASPHTTSFLLIRGLAAPVARTERCGGNHDQRKRSGASQLSPAHQSSNGQATPRVSYRAGQDLQRVRRIRRSIEVFSRRFPSQNPVFLSSRPFLRRVRFPAGPPEFTQVKAINTPQIAATARTPNRLALRLVFSRGRLSGSTPTTGYGSRVTASVPPSPVDCCGTSNLTAGKARHWGAGRAAWPTTPNGWANDFFSGSQGSTRTIRTSRSAHGSAPWQA